MSRGSYKWEYKVRNGDGNYIMSDVIHTREFIVYSPMVEPTPIISVTLEMLDPSGSSTLDSFKFRDI